MHYLEARPPFSMNLSLYRFHVLLLVLFNLLSKSNLALAEAQAKAQGTGPTLADGRPLVLPEDGLTITPPSGWEVLRNVRGKTLIMQVPSPNAPIKDYSKPLYSRNITLAVQHEPKPIDEVTAGELRAKLEKDFGQATGVRNFQILEHRFIDYRSQGDAILIYTAFDYSGFPMSQMHIFTAGSRKGVLLTYTDLAEDFQKNEAASTAAWNSMMSIELEGSAPQRYASLLPGGIAAAVLLLGAGLLLFLRRRRNRRFFEAAERRLYADDEESPRRRKSRVVSSAQEPLSSVTQESSVVW